MNQYIYSRISTAALVSIAVAVFMLQEEPLYGNQCKYKSEIEQCRVENLSGDPRSLEFLCPQNTNQEFQTYQVVLDGEFNEIDLEIDNYLTQLQAQKKRFYG
jgi:hypothetical protein